MHTQIWVIIGLVFSFLLGGCGNEETSFYSGTVEGVEVPILTEIGGAVQQVNADEGKSVHKGDVLAILDQRFLDQQVKEAQAAVALAQAGLEEIKAGARKQELTKALYQIQQSQAQIQQLQSQHAKIDTTREQRQALVEQAMSQLDGAKSTLDFQQKKLQDMEILFNKGVESQERFEAQREAVEQALASVNNLQGQVKVQEAQLRTTDKEKEAVAAQIKSAQAQEKTAEAQLDLLKEGATAPAIKQLVAQKTMAEARLEQARIALTKAIVTSPVEGVVVRKNVTKGEVLKPSYQLFTLYEEGKLELKVYVPEAKLQQVAIGKEVRITVDAYPEQAFKGKVKHIAEQAEFTPKNVQTPDERTKLVFEVTIELLEGWGKLKPGMPADITFAGSESP